MNSFKLENSKLKDLHLYSWYLESFDAIRRCKQLRKKRETRIKTSLRDVKKGIFVPDSGHSIKKGVLITNL